MLYKISNNQIQEIWILPDKKKLGENKEYNEMFNTNSLNSVEVQSFIKIMEKEWGIKKVPKPIYTDYHEIPVVG